MPDGGSGMGRLASELKALRLQAQRTEAELAQLHEQAPARSPLDALRGSEAAGGAALLGLALGVLALVWWWRRQRVSRSLRAAAVAESSFLPETPVPRPTGSVLYGGAAQRSRATPPEPGRAVPDAPVAKRPAERPLMPDSGFRPSSLDVTFVEHDALDVATQPAALSRADSFFASAEASLEFDPEAAANEVERVRKSLAAKRSERSRWSTPGSENVWNDDDPSSGPDALLHSEVLFAGSQPARTAGVDVSIDFPDDVGPAPANWTPVDTAVEPNLERNKPAPDTDHEVDVGVSLIQELQGLGLWSEARELAKELIHSAHAPLDADIASALHQVQHGTPANGGERRKKERG